MQFARGSSGYAAVPAVLALLVAVLTSVTSGGLLAGGAASCALLVGSGAVLFFHRDRGDAESEPDGQRRGASGRHGWAYSRRNDETVTSEKAHMSTG